MRFLERTKVYSFGEFRIENNPEIMNVDRQIGVWSRTNKKLYRAIVMLLATSLYCKTLTISPGNMGAYNLLHNFSYYGIVIYTMMSCLSNIVTDGKNFARYYFEDMFDGMSLFLILIVFAKYICSMNLPLI